MTIISITKRFERFGLRGVTCIFFAVVKTMTKRQGIVHEMFAVVSLYFSQ